MKLTGEQIRLLLRRKETERVEFKRAATALPANFWDSYSAFCNTDGGVIIFGVAQDKGGRFSKRFRTITFSNPGTMRISKSVAVAGGTSDARNTAIFNIFALVDIGERPGMGLANLHGLWEKYGYAEPKITESYDPDRTVITVTTDDNTVNETVIVLKPDQNPTRSTPKTVQKQSGSGAEAVQKLSDDGTGPVQKSSAGGAEAVQKQSLEVDVVRSPLNELPTSARQVLNAIADDCFMTQRGLVSKIGLAKSTIIKATAILIKNGYLRRVGPKKGGHWEVVEGSGE